MPQSSSAVPAEDILVHRLEAYATVHRLEAYATAHRLEAYATGWLD